MRYQRLFSLAIACAVVLGLAVGPAVAKSYKFRANTVGNKDSITYAGLEKFKELIESRSGGAINGNCSIPEPSGIR